MMETSDTTSRRTWQNVNSKRSAKNSKCTKRKRHLIKNTLKIFKLLHKFVW
jgi:hypothetical protein